MIHWFLLLFIAYWIQFQHEVKPNTSPFSSEAEAAGALTSSKDTLVNSFRLNRGIHPSISPIFSVLCLD